MMNTQLLRAHVAEMAKILAIQDNHVMIITRNDVAGSALFEAICINDTSLVRTLLSTSDAQSYINYTDVDGRTPIFEAACKGHTFIVSQLIAARFNVHLATTADGSTPLYAAASNGHDVVVTQLIAAGSNVDIALTTNGATPLYVAAQEGHVSVTKQLIEARCNVDLESKTNGVTPLFTAAQNGHTAIVKELIEARCNVDLQTNSGVTHTFPNQPTEPLICK
jgi:ankyrin repeat protein